MKFSYQAFDRSGTAAHGEIDANDANEARELLRRRGIYVLDIRQGAADTSKTDAGSGARLGNGRLLSHLTMFTRQLHVLLSTGTTLVDALTALERQTHDTQWKRILADIRLHVEEGASLSTALGHYPQYFNAICRGLIAAGESGGNLDVMLERLAVLMRKQLHLRSAIIGAMTYPILLIFVAVGVLSTLLVFVLPRFALLFKSLDTPLPPTTKLLMSLSDALRGYWWIILPAIIAAVLGSWTWLKTTQGRRLLASAALHLPRIGAMVRSFATAQISRLLGILLQGRVGLLDAIQLTGESMSNHHYTALLEQAGKAVAQGESLASVFANTDLVSPAVYEAMRSGDKSGQLGPLLTTVADFLDEENEVVLRSLTSILEPMILLVLGVLVGFVALSLFMPLFDLTAATRGGH